VIECPMCHDNGMPCSRRRNVGYVSTLCECGGDAVTWHDGRAVCEVCKELAERKEDCETREDEP
jgi:hypothetical protein